MKQINLIAGLRLVVSSAFVDNPSNFVDSSALLHNSGNIIQETLRFVVNLGRCHDGVGGLRGLSTRHSCGWIAVYVQLSYVTWRESLATEGTLVLHEMVETSGKR